MLKSLFLSTTDPGSGCITRDELLAIQGKLPSELRQVTAKYLRAAPMLFAWMGVTEDLLEGKFTVAGGTAVMADGEYYWRLDTADYVENYGIGLPADFLDHVSSRNWQPPEFDDLEEVAFFEELEQIMRKFPREDRTVPAVQTFYPSYWEPDDPRRHPRG